jgi:hypothetical protein
MDVIYLIRMSEFLWDGLGSPVVKRYHVSAESEFKAHYLNSVRKEAIRGLNVNGRPEFR